MCRALSKVHCCPKAFPPRFSTTLIRPPPPLVSVSAPGPTQAPLRLLSVGCLGRCTPHVTEVSCRGACPAHDTSLPGCSRPLASALRNPVSQPKLGLEPRWLFKIVFTVVCPSPASLYYLPAIPFTLRSTVCFWCWHYALSFI